MELKNKIYKSGLKSSFIFFGTPEFAAIILEKLIKAGFIPEAVVCNPDQLVGRKKILTPPPVKSLIIKNEAWNIKIKILQPEKLDSSFIIKVSCFKPDFFIVSAYGKIIPKEILDIPHLGTIGVHPSLLPKLRGPSPIQTAIINGDKKTGASLFMLDEKIDHGPILAKRECELKNENYEELSKKLAELAADLAIETLPKWLREEIKPAPQNETEATYTKMVKRKDGEINLQQETAEEIDRKIRALNPEPGTYLKCQVSRQRHRFQRASLQAGGPPGAASIKYQVVKILKANLVSDVNKISSAKEIDNFLIQEQKLYLKTKKGLLGIETLQPEGKKIMAAKDFINGYLSN